MSTLHLLTLPSLHGCPCVPMFAFKRFAFTCYVIILSCNHLDVCRASCWSASIVPIGSVCLIKHSFKSSFHRCSMKSAFHQNPLTLLLFCAWGRCYDKHRLAPAYRAQHKRFTISERVLCWSIFSSLSLPIEPCDIIAKLCSHTTMQTIRPWYGEIRQLSSFKSVIKKCKNVFLQCLHSLQT